MTINSQLFTKLLSKAFRAISTNAIVPALEYAHVRIKSGKIAVTGGNGENFITCWDDLDGDAEFLVPKQLLDYLSTLPPQDVEIEIGGAITVKAGKKKAIFDTLKTSEYVVIPEPDEELASLSGGLLKDVTASLLPFVSNDPLLPKFGNIKFGEKAVSSNRFSIARVDYKTIDFEITGACARFIKELPDGEITLHQSDRHTFFMGDNIGVISLIPAAKMMDGVGKMVDVDKPIKFSFQKADLLYSLKRAEILTSSKMLNGIQMVAAIVSLKVSNNLLIVSNEDKNFFEEIPVNCEDFESVFLNLKHFLPLISACDETIEVGVQDSANSVTVNSGDFKGLIMPVAPAYL